MPTFVVLSTPRRPNIERFEEQHRWYTEEAPLGDSIAAALA
jgi:hypothetical protein